MKKLGESITYEDPKGKKHKGKLLGVRMSGTSISDGEGNHWPGVQFYMQLRNGHRLWTITFPDTDREWVA